MADEVYAKYLGGGFYHNIPARDLTRAEFEALSHDQQMLVLASVHYEIVEVPLPKKKAGVKESHA